MRRERERENPVQYLLLLDANEAKIASMLTEDEGHHVRRLTGIEAMKQRPEAIP